MATDTRAHKINVYGLVLTRGPDGSYTGNVVRFTSTAGIVARQHRPNLPPEELEIVPWDVRVGQVWLRENPGAWVPVESAR